LLRYLSILLVLFSLGVNAQDGDGYLANFTGNHYKKSALLLWTTKIGFSCSDIKIEHSTDTTNFEAIYTWPGICGATTTEVDYTYEVLDLTPGMVHYFKLNMGFFGTSSVIKIFVPLVAKTALIAPHPATFESKLVYNLESGESANITIYNNEGVQVYFKDDYNSNTLELNQLGISAGMYYYTVTTGSKLFKGKFIYQ
jgi:hypothetical protein